jgi:hypothetical protein
MSQKKALRKGLKRKVNLSKGTRKQISEAVDAAVVPGSLQPIILNVMDCDDQNDSYELAYWPATRKVGNWFISALKILHLNNFDVHTSMVDAVSGTDDRMVELAFEYYYKDRIKTLASLGRFQKINPYDLTGHGSDSTSTSSDSDDSDDAKLPRQDLSTFLFHVNCFSSMEVLLS